MHVGNHSHAMNVSGIHACDLVKIRTHDFEQVLDRSIVAKSVTVYIELLPIECAIFEVLKDRAIVDLLIQPCEIASHAEIPPGTAHDRGIVHGIPKPYGLAGNVVG